MDGINTAANTAAPSGAAASPASSTSTTTPASSAAQAAPAATAPATGAEPSAPVTGVTQTPTETGTEQASAVPATGTESPDLTQTQAFSARFNEFRDKFIAEQGYQDIHGKPVTTFEQYQRATEELRQQQAQQQQDEQVRRAGMDPELFRTAVQQAAANLPVVQAMQQQMAETNRTSQIQTLESTLKTLAPNVKLDYSRSDFGLPNAEKISAYMKQGLPIADAYKLANFDTITQTAASGAQQAAVNQIIGTNQSTPGSLGAGATAPTYFTREQVQAMTPAQVKSNMKAIDESMKHWPV